MECAALSPPARRRCSRWAQHGRLCKPPYFCSLCSYYIKLKIATQQCCRNGQATLLYNTAVSLVVSWRIVAPTRNNDECVNVNAVKISRGDFNVLWKEFLLIFSFFLSLFIIQYCYGSWHHVCLISYMWL